MLVGAKSLDENKAIKSFLSRYFEQIPLSGKIAEKAVEIRQKKRIRLPDAIIQATAETESALLITRNIKDFPKDFPGVRVPYEL